MSQLLLPPYYHPTTVCFVDDNESFLESLKLHLPGTMAFLTFADPCEALEFLNAPPQLPPLVDRCFSLTPGASDTVIHLDLGMIEQEIRYPERFSRVSTAFIDFAMPLLNGLELCQRLTDPYLQKALLTGVADEVTAVAAFNKGLIHRFIPKSHTNNSEDLIRYMRELEQAYFYQHTARLAQNLAIDPPGYLVDPVVANYVRRVLRENDLVEFYLVSEPEGFLCLRADGSMVRMIIADEAQMVANAAFAARHGAPNDVVNRLRQRRNVAAFLDSPAYYSPDDPFPWFEYLLPTRVVAGERTWYVGLLHNPPMDIDFDFRASTHDAYRRRLKRA